MFIFKITQYVLVFNTELYYGNEFNWISAKWDYETISKHGVMTDQTAASILISIIIGRS